MFRKITALFAALVMATTLSVVSTAPAQAVEYTFTDASAWKSEGYGTETRVVVVWNYQSLSDEGQIDFVRYQIRMADNLPWYVDNVIFKNTTVTGRFYAQDVIAGANYAVQPGQTFVSMKVLNGPSAPWIRLRTDNNGFKVYTPVEIVAAGPAPNLEYYHQFKIVDH